MEVNVGLKGARRNKIMENAMNKKIKNFNQIVVENRKDSIKKNGDYLNVISTLDIDSYLKDPIEEIIIAYVLELDYVLSKSIPILLERFLLELCIRINSKYEEDIVSQRGRFEEKYGKELIKELKKKKIITPDEIIVFESIYDKNNSINRNFEIHNRELKKIKKSEIKFSNEDRSTSKEFDAATKEVVRKMVRTNPNFTHLMNRGKVKEAYQSYINFIINFSFKYSFIINSLGRLMNKSTYEMLEKQEKFTRFRLSLESKPEESVDELFARIEWIYDVKFRSEENEIELSTLHKMSGLDLMQHLIHMGIKEIQGLK